jgi:hypothetical protein
MRKQWLNTFLFVVLIYGFSYSQTVSKITEARKLTKRASMKIKPSYKFHNQLINIAFESIKISDGLREGDSQKVKDWAHSVMEKLFQFDAKVLSNKSNFPWYMHKIKMALRIKRIYNSDSLEMQKIYFDEFNRELYKSIISYGISGDRLYYLGCYEAFNNHSGYWFSKTNMIRNPYLANSKSDCGFVAEKFR